MIDDLEKVRKGREMKHVLAIVVIPWLVFAQSGRVVDEQNRPLAKATVESKVLGRRVMTNDNGLFDFASTPVQVRNMTMGKAHGMRVVGQILYINNPTSQLVTVDLFDMRGSKVREVHRGLLAAGEKALRLDHPGACIVKVTCNGKGEVLLSVGLGSSKTRSAEGSQPHRSSVTAGVSDTLVSFKYGYVTTTRVVSSTSNNLVVQLTRISGEIVPPGMKSLAGGVFMMGSEKGRNDETPVHRVRLDPFSIDSTLVTQSDYLSVMGTDSWRDYTIYSTRMGPMYPVWGMNWYDAALYCNARSKRDGLDTVYTYKRMTGEYGKGAILDSVQINYSVRGYRLPTEAEWEYAGRGGTTTEYFWGDSIDSSIADKHAWYGGNSGNKCHPVALKLPNAYGLYDMAGNMGEACNDFYLLSYYAISDSVNPKGPEPQTFRVARSIEWAGDFSRLRIPYRDALGPRYRDVTLSFRVVLPKL